MVKVNKEQEIGFHQGALQTLINERNELVRILQVVESLMKAHLNALKNLGIDVEKLVREAQEKKKKK